MSRISVKVSNDRRRSSHRNAKSCATGEKELRAMLLMHGLRRFKREEGMEKENISIYTIAEEAGVSPATVSRVLTGSARVSEEKRQRVQKLIDKYDFHPNAKAQGLSRVETKVIGLLVSDIRNPFYAEIVVACEKAAARQGYMIILCNSVRDRKKELAYLEKYYSQRVDAVIQLGGAVDELVSDMEYADHVNQIANKTPVLISGRLDGADCYQVCFDYRQSMELLMEYLIKSGHKEIALIGGNGRRKATVDKRLRYRQILRKYGLPVREEYIQDTNGFDAESGAEAAEQLLGTGFSFPTAVIADNDFLAVGIMRALQEHGFRIPEDISVAGFEDTYIARTCMPRLTCAGFDYDQYADILIHSAVSLAHGEEPPRMQTVEARLAIRDSCRNI